jgi:hypothetical protein
VTTQPTPPGQPRVPPRPVYPMRRRRGDDRFTTALARDVAAVLVAHGYPPLVTGNDLIHFTNRLHDAIYLQNGPQ